jgi:sugar lactone lactonase YvrE
MYHADTPTQVIHAYDYDAASALPSNRRVFARFTADGDRPDGAAVDAEGCYWIAFYGGGKIVKIAPDGRTLAAYAVPVMCPTMCAFGGRDLATLYVTSARQQRRADELLRLPQSGGIFAMAVDVPGLPEPNFAR